MADKKPKPEVSRNKRKETKKKNPLSIPTHIKRKRKKTWKPDESGKKAVVVPKNKTPLFLPPPSSLP
jgi:hypothetical protein